MGSPRWSTLGFGMTPVRVIRVMNDLLNYKYTTQSVSGSDSLMYVVLHGEKCGLVDQEGTLLRTRLDFKGMIFIPFMRRRSPHQANH